MASGQEQGPGLAEPCEKEGRQDGSLARVVVIDGFFLTEKVTGVQRYALEMIRQMDRLWDPAEGELEIAAPPGAVFPFPLEKIRLVTVGKRTGDAWVQIDLVRYLRKRKALVICMENFLPILYRKGLIMIHDISLKLNRHLFRETLRGRLSVRWRCLHYWLAAHSGMKIGTVSENAKQEIVRAYGVRPERVTVIYSAWQHMDRVEPDESVLEGISGDYYLALSSLAPTKNFRWVVEAARNHPREQFLIAGGGDVKQFLARHGAEGLKNLHLLGYVTDGQAKALMARCKAFLFPTLYEGFGLPPLEAVAAGAEAVVLSDLPVLHEVYGEAGTYIDPRGDAVTLPPLKILSGEEKRALLDRFSWERSAKIMLDTVLGRAG